MYDDPVLAVIPGATDRDRLLLVMSAAPGASLSLVQQSWSESTGWYNQTSIALTPDQVAQLRMSLGRGGAAGRAASSSVDWAMPSRRTTAPAAQVAGATEAAPAILSLSQFRQAESA